MNDENSPPVENPGPNPPAGDVPTGNPPADPPSGAPPAAALVVAGQKSERELELETQLADTSGQLSERDRIILERERKIMELERDNETLKASTPGAPSRPPRKSWRDELNDI